jgi:hypothetical protein
MTPFCACEGFQRNGLASDIGSAFYGRSSVGDKQEHERSRDYA